jgi:uncharacterized protein
MSKKQAPDAPKIEFPLDYPIKVIGDNEDNLAALVSDIVKQFDPKFDAEKIVKVPSSKGTFVSLRFSIWATGEDQLGNMHETLIKLSCVKMVL